MDIIVIGPVNGKFHVGFWNENAGKFYSFAEFENKELAEVTAYRQQQFNLEMHVSLENKKG